MRCETFNQIDWADQIGKQVVETYNEKNRLNAARARLCEAGDHSACKACWWIKANGMVFASGNTLGRKVEMGDVIVVPTKVKTERDWTRTLTAITGATAGVLGSILLITKL